MRYLVVFLLYIIGTHAQAEDRRPLLDSLDYKVEMQASLSAGDHTPLWLNANKYGLSSLEKTNGYLRGALSRPLSRDDGRRWGIGYGLDVAVAGHYTSRLIIQQAYVEGRWLKGVLSVGSKEYPMELKNQELSTGAQTLGVNARPVPQVRLALPEYWDIPGTNGWVSLKGHIAYGKYTDSKWQKDFTHLQSKYTEGVLYHSKAGYLKIGNDYKFMPVSLELGLEMASQFGGSSFTHGEVIKSESGLKAFWHALTFSGTDTGEAGETGAYENVGGNHLGSWLIRLNFDYDAWYLGLYAEHFFEDHSSMFFLDYDGYGSGEEWNTRKSRRYFLYSLKDIMLGIELKLKQKTWLNNIVLEYIYTKYQSGPVYHDHTQNISSHISGRDNYYNHHIFTGWQHWGQVMGNPLYLSPLYNEDGVIEIRNNRFWAWHLGLSGNPLPDLHYRVLATYQKGWGTYYSPYIDPRKSFCFLAEASYELPHNWLLKGSLGMDSGKIYGENYGIQLTVTKTGILKWRRR
ncbi:MAG: hypothetical protein IJ552_03340 [Prevotella sp.]|nr:hypothetical protein [Prevotella sp.]MBQ8714227.1 hypothetical protein [Prevotella sp.]